ncbi:MAG: RluA family pseudouridine synthase [Candidatus Marinimicrobia bacterium]|nr:RluA family pseudouridine synthase [Candidatus Neomarinimicrobiota bacterium]MBT3676651.1 RluA family pseudouridine synthase [Candidatus Neomarinimicrobiota bacterium]MBT3762844.1 RluA family pseudouridine synthase [Candidatus Neomarinimicrobiota bacterium]MBT4068377.1 RluA family pseudouridine synthase [Candidatus Neomarinimicrobiota bacterium]MBT4270728.1 RluA family pseudouridine synthase [Candidatus Neomarinimicrobiota bacterium]
MSKKILSASGGENTRLDIYLTLILPDLSRTQIQNMIRDGLVLVNDQPSKSGLKLDGSESIEYSLPEKEPELNYIEPEEIPLDILFEDEDIIAINKPAGMVVHPGVGNKSGTLVNALAFHFDNLSDINGNLRPGIVHRLDEYTTGVILVAKHNKAHAHLASQFENRSVQKEYVGVTWGHWKDSEGSIDGAIKRKRSDPTTYQIDESGRQALTHYKTVNQGSILSEVKFFPKTGRTHQIRVHSASMNHPIFGDEKYGGSLSKAKGFIPEVTSTLRQLFKGINRHALHARKISFQHPSSGESIQIEASIPDDIKTLIQGFDLIHG